MMTAEEMTTRRDALLAARYRGVRTVEIEGRRITYATDAEMATAISDLSPHLEDSVERGWVYGSLMFGEMQVRTGHLIVGTLQDP